MHIIITELIDTNDKVVPYFHSIWCEKLQYEQSWAVDNKTCSE